MHLRKLSLCRHSVSVSIVLLALAVAVMLTSPARAQSAQPQTSLVKLSKDTFKNSSSQHATEVEPDTYAYGSEIVTAFQVGRISGGGSSDIGFATSTDAGATWKHGYLPGITTFYKGGKYDAASDAAVVYDADHGVWLISSLGLANTNVVLANSSSDGLTWNNPAVVDNTSGYADKDWITCDNTSTSPYYGHCYIEWEDAGNGDQVRMSTSTDGGQTWSKAFNVPNAIGLGGQPVAQPNGTAVVPFWGFANSEIQFYTSTNGGKTWGNVGTISTVTDHEMAGNLRGFYPLPSAELDGAGTVYVVWQDCRFRKNCSSNDIVMSTSSDGKTWSKVSRIPIDAVSSTVDHFIPGIGVDPSTSGTTAHLVLTYYFYPVANCTAATCQLGVGFVSSTDGGKTWTHGKTLTKGMNVSWLPSTSLGQMVADYISTSFVNGKAFGVFAKASQPTSKFNEAMFTPAVGLIEEENGPYFSSEADRPVPNAKSDHGPMKFWDSDGKLPRPEQPIAPQQH